VFRGYVKDKTKEGGQMNYWIPISIGFISWVFIMWIIWKARKEVERLNEKKRKNI